MKRALVVLLLSAAVASPPTSAAMLTSRRVRASIDHAVRYLQRSQRRDGTWPAASAHQDGVTALATLALLNAGVPATDPGVAVALNVLRRRRPSTTYVASLQAMALAAGRPKHDHQRLATLADMLARGQHRRGKDRGLWGYDLEAGSRGDHSNTQFALLGLKAAADAGVQIDQRVWQRAAQHWIATQGNDGGWAYTAGNSYGSMTCAGVASLVICGASLESSRVRWLHGQVVDCGRYSRNRPLERGIEWLSTHFSATANPGTSQWYFYYMYALERAGRLSGVRLFGNHDWYREGATALLRQQDTETGAWELPREPAVIATSFALLFLAKGSYPVVVNKLRWDGDWNRNRYDVHHLVAWVSRAWDRPMTWQVVDIATSRAEDLTTAPVLYITGHKAPRLSNRQRHRLAEYVRQGGFVLAEACCGARPFDTGFRQLMADLFGQEGARLRRLPPDHAVWGAYYVLDPDTFVLEGIDFGGRTRVVYSPTAISCLWEGPVGCPVEVRTRAFHMGTNILAYATGRNLPRDKLAAQAGVDADDPDPQSGVRVDAPTTRVARIRHNGRWDVAPAAVTTLAFLLRRDAHIRISTQGHDLFLHDAALHRHRLAVMTGRAAFTFTVADRQALRQYIDLGGTLLADAAGGSPDFDQAFRNLMAETFPMFELERIPVAHPLFARVGPRIDTVTYTDAVNPAPTTPFLEAISIRGRLAVIYSKYDLSLALAGAVPPGCRGYSPGDACRIATNVAHYALAP